MIDCESKTAVLGEGRLPDELNRVNWAVIWWGILWPLFQGVWSWVLILLALPALAFMLNLFVLQSAPNALRIGISLFILLVTFALTVALAYRANRLVWLSAGRRLQRQAGKSAAPKSMTWCAYLESQSRWARYGAIVFALLLPYNLWQVRTDSSLLTRSAILDFVHLLLIGTLYLYEKTGSAKS